MMQICSCESTGTGYSITVTSSADFSEIYLRTTVMSCDWDKYSTAAQTKERAKNPEINGVLQFGARDARGLPDQRLAHDPQEDNRAHSQLFGEKTTEIRLKLKRLCKWAIPISQPV